MTQFADLVNRAWMHARNGDLYLAGWDSIAFGGKGAILSDEPTAYTEGFIEGIERVSGMAFERIPLPERDQLELELERVTLNLTISYNRNYLTEDDVRHQRDLRGRVKALRQALAIIDEEQTEEALAGSQFGVGA